jgi:predicted Zn-dependent protease
VRIRLIGFVAVIGLLAWSPGSATAVSAPQGLNLISVNDEIELGRQTQAQVRAETPSVNDSAVSGYLSGVFSQLARRATGPRYPYSVSIANYAEVNAFSLPGGPVWIHRGAIEAAQNESQLAGVLAHEIGHIERRHVAQQISKQMVAGGLLALLGRVLPNDRAGKIGEVAANITAQTVMLKFSRSDESEADREGTRMLQAAGWDARGLADFLDVLRAKSGGDPSSVGVFLSNHPAPGERAAALRAAGLRAGGKRDSTEFQQVRSRLRQMPPAPHMKR